MKKIKKAKKIANLKRKMTSEEISKHIKDGWILAGMSGKLLCKKGHRKNIETGFHFLVV